jgi:hypothetical protein
MHTSLLHHNYSKAVCSALVRFKDEKGLILMTLLRIQVDNVAWSKETV